MKKWCFYLSTHRERSITVTGYWTLRTVLGGDAGVVPWVGEQWIKVPGRDVRGLWRERGSRNFPLTLSSTHKKEEEVSDRV